MTKAITYNFINTPLKKTYENAGIIDGIAAQPFILEEKIKLLAGLRLLFDPGASYAFGL